MEILLILALGFLMRGTWDHVKTNYGQSRDQRVAEVAKSFPKGTLPKSRQKAAARQHAAGWWAREIGQGFPVTRTGWSAAWLAHKTTADHHRARREEARTNALETRASVLKELPDHKQRQAEAQAELDKIREQLAATGGQAKGRKAVREAADEVALKRAAKQQREDGERADADARAAADPACRTCRGSGTITGNFGRSHCGCVELDRGWKPVPRTPPLPADGVSPAPPQTPGWIESQRAARVADLNARRTVSGEVTGTPVRVRNAEDSAWLEPGEKRCEGCGGTGGGPDGGACPVCRGFGSAPPDPASPLADADAVCTACGNKGKPGDPVLADPGGNIHLSHAKDKQEAYWDRLNRLRNGAPGPDAARNPQPLPGPEDGERDPDWYTPEMESRRPATLGVETWQGVLVATRPGATRADLDEFCRHGHWSVTPEVIESLAAREGYELPWAAAASSTTPSPTTEGTPSVSDTTYDGVIAAAKGQAAHADDSATSLRSQLQAAERIAEDMQAAKVDPSTLSAQLDHVDRLRAAVQAVETAGESADIVTSVTTRNHGGINEAVQNAPVKAADPGFYEG